MALSTMWPCGRSVLTGGGVGGAACLTAWRRENARSVGRRRRSDMMGSPPMAYGKQGELASVCSTRRSPPQRHARARSIVLRTADPESSVLKGDQVKRERYDWRDRYS